MSVSCLKNDAMLLACNRKLVFLIVICKSSLGKLTVAIMSRLTVMEYLCQR